jgi:hypothetical protein
MGQRFTSFIEVDRLDAESLKALLVGGEPPERVWAAWALGLRHHEAFARELRATAAEEPHAGVRRHLVVVLAGAGERRSILTMAAHDPDERVRATALQYVARLAGPGDDDANRLVADALAHEPPLLRLGCIAGLRADAPPALWAAVAACVRSADRDLRWAAYEAALRHGGFARSAPELARELLHREPERSTRVEALRLLPEHAGAEALARLVSEGSLDAHVFPEVVDALQAHGVRMPWGEVENLMARFPNDRHRALELLAGNEGPARSALLRLFVAARLTADRSRESWKTDAQVLLRLRGALDQDRGPLDESERSLRLELAEFVDKAAEQARTDPQFLDDVDWPVEVSEGPFDPLSLSWFCEEEREVLARLAVLEVH